MRAAIEVEGVWKSFRVYHQRSLTLKEVLTARRSEYEIFWALRDVNFTLPSGKMLGIIGHNGSGKSTLLKCLARIMTPNAGRILVNGKVSSLLELGTGFHTELSGRENLYLAGSILGLSKQDIDSRFDDIVDFAAIGPFIDMPVKNYSSGMYARLAFALAINVDAEVLLVDEVLSVGDAEFQRRSYRRITELLRGGSTIVFVSHALDAVRSLCDLAIWMDEGHPRLAGPAAEVVETYLAAVGEEALVSTSSGPLRTGTGEIVIERLTMHDQTLAVKSTWATGETGCVRIEYVTEHGADSVAVTVEVHDHTTGELISGVQTGGPGLTSQPAFELAPGAGTIELHLSKLPLWPGDYDLSVGLHNAKTNRVYDWHDRVLRFQVFDDGTPRVGPTPILGTWMHWNNDTKSDAHTATRDRKPDHNAPGGGRE
jgi:ABC-type polysaccharide/polyol phosphate transport system ATPase subunit